jgi:UDP-2,3-diacylglucosamine pyrophosphatase LpxH
MEYRTIWISDLHLGTHGCNAAGVLDFLRQHECKTLYLVGDIIDIWRLKKDHYWPQSHNDVVQKILRKGRKGTKIIVIPGNHDEFCSNFLGVYGNILVKTRDVYTAHDGRRLLIMHGHEFDAVTTHAKWMAYLGDAGYTLLLEMNRPLNWFRRHLGLGYWSLSAYVKSRVKNAVSYISQFEDAVVRFAQMHAADGIVCGHIHTPAVRSIRGLQYFNCGDWVESSTALVEHMDGRIELVHWKEPAADTAAPAFSTRELHDQSDLMLPTTLS